MNGGQEMDDRTWRYVTLGAVGVAALLGFGAVAAVRRLDARLSARGEQIRLLGEATERLTVGMPAPALRAKDELPEGITVLHPEVENALGPAAVPWPPVAAARGGVLTRSFDYGEPKGFNVLLESSGILEDRIYTYCRLRLAERNAWKDPSSYYGTLAFRVEVTDDSKEFTAYLRRGVLWHPAAGVPLDDPKYAWLRAEHEVTARDLAFTLELVANPRVRAGAWKSYYSGIESWKALDDHTFVVRWKRKDYANRSATLDLWPTPRFLYAHDEQGTPFPDETLGVRFNQHWYDNKGFVGAGPYRMTRYEPGSRIVLERNERALGDKPAIQKLVYLIYSDATQTRFKLRSGELDDGELTAGQYREEIANFETAGARPANSPFFDGRIGCEKVPRFAYSYVAWNAARPFFSDQRVRRAMTLAMDRRRIIDGVFARLGTLATGPFAADSPNNDPAVVPIEFDLERARRLLEEAGFRDTNGDGILDRELRPGDGVRSPFEFRLSFAAGQKEAEATAKIFADDLSKIGVRVVLEPQEWSLLQRRKDERSYDATMASRTTSWLADLYPVWHSSQADVPNGANIVGFRNAAVDLIIEKLRQTFDESERVRLFRAFHSIVADEQPYTFVMTRASAHCAWSHVKNRAYSKLTPVANTLPWWLDRAHR
jgi:peptide/nickel transport system substrate-binding protein